MLLTLKARSSLKHSGPDGASAPAESLRDENAASRNDAASRVHSGGNCRASPVHVTPCLRRSAISFLEAAGTWVP
jgi:hypothetical protein